MPISLLLLLPPLSILSFSFQLDPPALVTGEVYCSLYVSGADAISFVATFDAPPLNF
jgi:hypothetical protein